MTIPIVRSFIFDAVKRLRGGKSYDLDDIKLLDDAIDAALGIVPPPRQITARAALELICHEAIVQEAYLDSVKVWSWSVGLTAASGVNVLAFKDNPQPLKVCLAAYIDRLTKKYLPPVLKAFEGFDLTDEQLAASLSFHYNTGAIGTATWVQSFKDGRVDAARKEIMNWSKPKAIVGRRTKERDLFFKGEWCSDDTTLVYPVKKPGYTPDWGNARRVDVRPIIEELLA